MCLLLLDAFYRQLIDVCFLSYDELVYTLVKAFYLASLAINSVFKLRKSATAQVGYPMQRLRTLFGFEQRPVQFL